MSSQPTVAIIGGGPAGLTLGLLLHNNNVPFTIFEARPKPTDEELAKTSGMLDLHEESGLAAIRDCGLYDDFIKLTGECTEDFIVAERSGNILYTMKGGGTRPEVSRNNLTKLLLSKIPKEDIRWGHKLLSATSTVTAGHPATKLEFNTNNTHTFDFVVGADGAWSKVRNLLTDTKPHYSGMQNITITIRGITKKYPHLASLLGTGTFSSLGNRHAIITQRGPYDSARIYLWLTHPDENFGTTYGLSGKPAKSAQHKLLEDDSLLGTFGAIIKELVTTACNEESEDNPNGSLDIRALYTLPHGTSWKHNPGATIVGDAAHLMLPNGEGVNLAMLDSRLLSQAIIKSYKAAPSDPRLFQQTLDPLLRSCEADLVARAEKEGHDTVELMGRMLGDNAANDLVAFFQAIMEASGP